MWAWVPAGLNLLLELLVMFESSNVATQFYQTYYMQLINEIFAVMTGDLQACPASSVSSACSPVSPTSDCVWDKPADQGT